MSGATTGKMGIYKRSDKAYQNQRVGNFRIIKNQKMIFAYRDIIIMNLSDIILRKSYGGSQPNISPKIIHEIKIPLPPLEIQKEVVKILDKFEALVNDVSIGLPAELNKRKTQYEYYRNKLLTFKKHAI